jgi:3-hydroxy-9,10-secoandrosta-1,3,5(10)-triene-9,17-dione monooxygenase reductase component
MQAAAALDQTTFRQVCSRYATGIAVATVNGPEGEPHGLTVNSFTSVSCNPPLVLVCIDYRCTLLPMFRASSVYGINVLSEEQQHLSVRFSRVSAEERFAGLEWNPGQTGVPVLGSCLATFECAVTQIVEAGDHAIFIGEIVSARCSEGKPLLYFGSSYARLKEFTNG